MALPFEFVKNCKPGDLVRVKIEEVVEFAILGANEGHSLRALVVLKDNEAPFAINLLETGRVEGDFETYAALVYGKCEILPDHSDRCEIGTGRLFTKVGALVLAEDGSSSSSGGRCEDRQEPSIFRFDQLEASRRTGRTESGIQNMVVVA